MGIPDHLTYLLRSLYAGHESTIRTAHETTDWFQTGKGVCQGCILSLCLFNLYAAPVLWRPHAKSWLIGKDSDAGRDWGQEEKGMTEDEMAVWHHWLNGRESKWTLGVGDGQGGLACCDSWGHKESDMTERQNWTEHFMVIQGGTRLMWNKFWDHDVYL